MSKFIGLVLCVAAGTMVAERAISFVQTMVSIITK